MVQAGSQSRTSPDGKPLHDSQEATGGDGVPERPELAPGVVLAGEMQDGAFEEKQWLVQRDGQYVQLTELLYHTAEQIDGQRTLDEIAAGLSEAIDRKVSADNVRQLVGGKLIPIGLVKKADGSVVSQETPDGSSASRSPLQINMRVRVLSPRIIGPFTAVLEKLYWPPILVAMLVVAAAAQVYVFVIHGIASSVHELLYHPVLMFAVLALIIVGTIWHEFGHASALRYGGGEVRGMGVGVYLVYPAFFTDVTDNYRLSRWNRVRTDLGGFYFNLIWSAGTVGVFLLTKSAWLLLLVLLIDLEIIQQTLPFGRYDGYWTLADLTGVPDFFSKIPDFVRYVVPFMKTRDSEFARYKGWVRVAFALYVVIATPVIAFIFFMMIKNAPRVAGTGWASARVQASAFSAAYDHGHILPMIVAGGQLLILVLPTLGLAYILFNLARRGGKALWNYSKKNWGNRIKGSLIFMAIVAFLAFLWAPQLPLSGGRPGPWYSASSWRPVQANERGTLGDAGSSIGQIPIRYNPWRTSPPNPPRPRGRGGAPRPTPRPGAVAKLTATAQATRTRSTPTAGAKGTSRAATRSTATAQAHKTAPATRTATRTPVSGARTPTPAPTFTPVPTQPAVAASPTPTVEVVATATPIPVSTPTPIP